MAECEIKWFLVKDKDLNFMTGTNCFIEYYYDEDNDKITIVLKGIYNLIPFT